jgi:hypothetical protein
MRTAGKAQLVPIGARLTTPASKSGRKPLTFLAPRGQIVDGHERSMAGTDCAPGCTPGDRQGG